MILRASNRLHSTHTFISGGETVATYIEYELEDGTTVLVETSEPEGGVVKAARDADGNLVKRANQKFEAALAGVKPWAAGLRRQLNDLVADEIEVTFGLKTVGEVGNFAVGKVGGEANYEVTLKWSNRKSE
jgi:hypothetical protein